MEKCIEIAIKSFHVKMLLDDKALTLFSQIIKFDK